MHKISIINLREGKKYKLTAFTHTNEAIVRQQVRNEKKAPYLNFTQEVSEVHIILNDEVCIKTFGGDTVLLLQCGTVANPSAAGLLLDVSRGWCISVTCEKEKHG